jgi:hypothetical protein
MTASRLVRIEECVHINLLHIVSIVPAPMMSNAIRFDIRMTNGEVHAWPVRNDEDIEGALNRLLKVLIP